MFFVLLIFPSQLLLADESHAPETDFFSYLIAGDIRLSHIHGMGYLNDRLYLATHTGIVLYHDGKWTRTNAPNHDFMGFSVGSRGIYFSGHPSATHTEVLPNPLGIMFSDLNFQDGHFQHTEKGFQGSEDFHILASGFYSGSVFSVSLKNEGDAILYFSSDEGESWLVHELTDVQGGILELSAHPQESQTVLLLTTEGVFLSENGGEGFRSIIQSPDLDAAVFSPVGTILIAQKQDLIEVTKRGDFIEAYDLPQLDDLEIITSMAISNGSRAMAIVTSDLNVYIREEHNHWKQILRDGTEFDSAQH